MSLSSSISTMRQRFHRYGGQIDIIRDPYKAWFWLCTILLICLLAVVAVDSFVFYQEQTGQLVKSSVQSQVPPPIIDQGVLTTTAREYADRTATLAQLESGGPTKTAIIDPSK
jgi:hypothetical protein